MYCPSCCAEETKVIDSRLVSSGVEIKRRRECVQCQWRFTTYERIQINMPKVQKREGYPVDFSDEKLRYGILKAIEKRPVSVAAFEAMISYIKQTLLSSGEQEISTDKIGSMVLKELKKLDPVAYVRYASVYFSVETLDGFQELIQKSLREEPA